MGEFNRLQATEALQGDSFLCGTKSQKFLIFISLTLEGSKSVSTIGSPSCFEPWTPRLEIQHPDYQAITYKARVADDILGGPKKKPA